MAVGDAVVINQLINEEGSYIAPLHGIVNAEAAGDALVAWRNGQKSTVPQAELAKVFPGPENLVGQWAQIAALPFFDPPDDFDGFGPKSPAAAGLIIDVFGTSDFGGQSADQEWVVIATEDGRRAIKVVFSEAGDSSGKGFVIKPGARNV